jgi:HPt (histidine-containing phosphotransfer) domain-containing protein
VSDVTLLNAVFGAFIHSSDRMLVEMRRAVEQKDYGATEFAAHALKGSISNFGPTPALETVSRLELAALARDLDGAAALIAQRLSPLASVPASRHIPRSDAPGPSGSLCTPSSACQIPPSPGPTSSTGS